MTIELLGDNCRKCRLLKNNIELALEGFSTDIQIKDVGEPEKFVEYGLLSLPGVVVDGVVKAEGQLLTTREIVAMLTDQ